MNIESIKGNIPLEEYPWYKEIDKLLEWLKGKPLSMRAFCFDIVMSLAYIDATAGIEKYIQFCHSCPEPYNSHLGFINLCAPCYEKNDIWVYQKATKPQSGALGKLSSEIILRFIYKLSENLEKVFTVGGVEVADAALYHKNGTVILAEVKSAPLITYPVLFSIKSDLARNHQNISLTSSQLKDAESALYLHNKHHLPLGKVGDLLWPFQGAVHFLTAKENFSTVNDTYQTWLQAKSSYTSKNKDSKLYYLANASGTPPNIAKTRDGWPEKESISDSKTSAGMDRTDDIKKGIYQTLKIGANYKKEHPNLKTALISNLPAYRHGADYVSPFLDMLWGHEAELENLSGISGIKRENLRRVFDYIITLEDPVLRDIGL